jgi:hypothetical protein
MSGVLGQKFGDENLLKKFSSEKEFCLHLAEPSELWYREIRSRQFMILKIFLPKNSAKMAFSTQSKAKLCKILIITLVLEKKANFSPKIVENRRKL